MKYFLTFISLLLFTIQGNSQIEKKYAADANSPVWVHLLYDDASDPAKVIEAHDAYYASRTKVKNEHTQYYKRWLRSFSRRVAFDRTSQSDRNYLKKSKAF